MKTRSTFTALALAFGLAAGAVSAHAWGTASRLTYLTFSGPVALPGVTLDAGTYAFELLDPSNSGNIVSVRDRNRARSFYLGMTQVVPRPAGMDEHSTVALGEAPRGEPKPIVAWYPPDAAHGLQFIYAR
jgi:hypothetical protein